MVSTPKSHAARLMAVDTARRATQAPTAIPTPQAQQPTTLQGAEQADKTRDVVAAAVVDNERVQQSAVDPTRATAPALPATPTGIPTADQGPFRVPGSDTVITPAQTVALDDERTRLVTAMAIADPIARREAVVGAFATPELFATAQATFASLPADERKALLGDVADTTDLQAAVLAQKQGFARNTFVDAVRERAGIGGGALPVSDSAITDRALEIEGSLVEQSRSVRLTDEQRERGMNSGIGVVRAAAGGAAMFAGGTAMMTPTGVGQVAGSVVAVHGFDNFQAGVRQALSGEPVSNATEQVIAAGAEQLGFDPQTAANIGAVGDALVGFGASATLSRVTSTTAAAVADDLTVVAATVPRAP